MKTLIKTYFSDGSFSEHEIIGKSFRNKVHRNDEMIVINKINGTQLILNPALIKEIVVGEQEPSFIPDPIGIDQPDDGK